MKNGNGSKGKSGMEATHADVRWGRAVWWGRAGGSAKLRYLFRRRGDHRPSVVCFYCEAVTEGTFAKVKVEGRRWGGYER